MSQVNVDPKSVSLLAGLAGLKLGVERCTLLCPELDWIMKEAQKLRGIDWTGIEPANIFIPGTWQAERNETDRS